MPDPTDSYCERCGTRYAFSTNAPKILSLSGARVLARGLKSFVLTDGQSINDAMTIARNASDHEDASRATEAFRRTFNFCLTCRQYACSSCWNERQGACLTCAPEPELEPVAPEDHLIVRTPVARGDNDWALFPGIVGVDSGVAPNASPTLAGWPSQDLEMHPPAVVSDGDGKGGHDEPPGELEEGPAWSMWPIADEISPEMTLTPEELALVQARLATEEPVRDAPAVAEAIAQQTLPEVPAVEAWVLRSNLAGDLARLGEPSQPSAGDRSEPTAGRETPAAEEQRAPLATAGMAPPPQPALAREQGPAVARLLSRLGRRGDGGSPARGNQPPPRGSQTAGDPWPRPTLWSERQIGPRESSDGTPAVAEPEAAPIEPILAAVPYTSLPAAPVPAVPLPAAPVPAVPLPFSPVPPATTTPSDAPVPVTAGQEVSFEILPASDDIAVSPGLADLDWPKTDREVIEAPGKKAQSQTTPGPAPRVAAGPSSQGPREPAPWPPLGASWPARVTRGAPWPGPDAPPVPAAVAAKHAVAPIVAEMWAQSAQEVLNRGSVRVCHHCALPVSTQARFCRRCGTKQA